MSAAAGKQKLLQILKEALKEDTRAVLDVKVHIADLNKNTLIRANRLNFTNANAADSEFSKSYKKFVKVVGKLVPGINNFKQQQLELTDIELAASLVSNPKIKIANIWLEKEKLLVSSGFSAMSTLRTKIYSDTELITDIYFGKSNRVRSIYDQLKDRGVELDISTIPDEEALTSLLKGSSAKDAMYIFPEMGTKNAFGTVSGSGELKVYQLSSKKEGKKSIGILNKVSDRSFETVAVLLPDGNVRIESAKKYIGYKVAVDVTGDISVYPHPEGKNDAVLLDSRLLSVADVGHAYFKDRVSGKTPAGEKLNIPKEIVEAFSDTQIQRVNAQILNLQKKLNKAHGAVDFTFYKSSIQNKINTSKSDNVSIQNAIVVVFQDYKINNRLSTIERNLLARFTKEITKEILRIPGSNTLKQDLVDIYSNRAIKPLLDLGKQAPKKLISTSDINVKKDINIKSNVIASKGQVNKIVSSKTSVPIPQSKATFRPITSSLTSLQNLINANLQNVISANMADGSSRSILNYRTGRFAASASVERMSESRAGMITAFYTYMKNPYQTFEPGYAQGSPKSRDPKLLISKSIREIAATKVGNRLRAVLI